MKKEKQKGYKLEHYLETLFRKKRIACQRLGQPGQPDLYFKDLKMTGECKNKKNLKTIYDMKGNKDFLFLKWSSRKVRKKPILVVMELKTFLKIINKRS